MYYVVSENTPIKRGEIRVESETNDRIAVTRYDNSNDIEGNVMGYISLGDIIIDVVFHNRKAEETFSNLVKEIAGGKEYCVTAEVIDSLEMIGNNC